MRFLVLLAKTLAVLCAVLIVIVPLALLARPDIDWARLQWPVDVTTGWLLMVGIGGALAVVYVLWRGFHAVIRAPFGSWNVFGGTVQARLLGLAVAVVLAPDGIAALARTPLTVIFSLLERLPRMAVRIPSPYLGSGATYNIREPFVQVSLLASDTFAEVAQALQRGIEQVFIPEVAIGVALWAIFGHVFTPQNSVFDGKRPVSSLRLFVASMTQQQRQVAGLALVFLVGAYLSVAAIVAIPWLQEEEVPPGLARESVDKILTSMLPASPAVYEQIVKSLPQAGTDPLSDLAGKLNQGGTLDRALATTVTAASQERLRAITVAQQAPAQLAVRAAQLKSEALTSYDLETASPMSSQERGLFVRQIRERVSAELAAHELALRTCVARISQAEIQFADASRSAAVFSAMKQPTSAMPDGPNAQPLLQLRSQLNSAIDALRQRCEEHPSLERTNFIAPAAGTGWGPFGAAARWLLRTKSLALALITGMLGFGLLGSVLSTMVRAEGSSSSVTSDVISVLVRGWAAAVIVFLAVKGGLAVFSATAVEPNPYVVFFTCLAGAVFSEDVWKWARARFLGEIGKSQAQSPPTPTPTSPGSSST